MATVKVMATSKVRVIVKVNVNVTVTIKLTFGFGSGSTLAIFGLSTANPAWITVPMLVEVS